MRILVTGASGLLGLNFALQYCDSHEILGVANQHGLNEPPFELRRLDLSQPGVGARLVAETRPDLVLHCAALANLELAEQRPDLARRLNAEVPGELAAAARRSGAQMVHISTDCVFDGLKGGYAESDRPDPINTYARTKLDGEKAVAQANPQAIIARVNFYGWSMAGTRSLGEFFVSNLQAGRKVMGFTDVIFCTLQVNVLGEVLMEMVKRRLGGLYHVVSSECLSKYEFGCRIARQFGLDAGQITPVSWAEAGLKAARSPDLSLRSDKLARALDEVLPAQAAGIALFYRQYREGYAEKIKKLESRE
jgi:dTDP-4-dehydrorhamnose reductase